MSATVYSVPTAVHIPDFEEMMVDGRYSMTKDDELRDKFFTELRAWLAEHNYVGKASGEVVRWGRGDGYAEYMVAKLRPLILIHLPLGDAWSMDEIFLRGLTAKDVTKEIGHQNALNELFGHHG